MDCSWYDLDALAAGGYFVETESYAIAVLCYANSSSGNSMGLILDARGPLFPQGPIAYRKRRLHLESERTLYVFYHQKTLFTSKVRSLRSSVKGAGPPFDHMMNTNIESSTEGGPCTKLATVVDHEIYGF